MNTRLEKSYSSCSSYQEGYNNEAGPAGCVSTTFQTYGVEYSHVCGRVIGYHDKSPDAFGHFANHLGGTEIDSVYVDGVSLTHGQTPQQHIWTFAGAVDESARDSTLTHNCPCIRPGIPYAGTIPSFVGQDYFCDTGSREVWSLGLSTLCPQKILLYYSEMLLNIPYYANYLHLLFSNLNSKINAFADENVTESSEVNQLLNTFCIVH